MSNKIFFSVNHNVVTYVFKKLKMATTVHRVQLSRYFMKDIQVKYIHKIYDHKHRFIRLYKIYDTVFNQVLDAYGTRCNKSSTCKRKGEACQRYLNMDLQFCIRNMRLLFYSSLLFIVHIPYDTIFFKNIDKVREDLNVLDINIILIK